MPEWRAESIEGRELSAVSYFGGHLGILLYADRLPSPPLLRYLEVLWQRYRDHGAGLRVLLAVAPEHFEFGPVEEAAARLSFPVAGDSDGRLRRTLGLAKHADRSFLVGADGTVALSAAGILGREELRQHVEKHLLGQIEYETSPVTLLGPQALLPAWEVRRFEGQLAGEPQPYTPAAGTTVVALTAELCAACNPIDVYEQVATYWSNLCGDGPASCRMELLVTAGFPLQDLLSSVAMSDVESLPTFQATSTLAGLEDEYFTTRQGPNPKALVLRMGPGGRVQAVTRLEEEVEVSHD